MGRGKPIRPDIKSRRYREEAIKINHPFENGTEEVKADKELAFRAVKESWKALAHVSVDPKADKEVALGAVKQSRNVLG